MAYVLQAVASGGQIFVENLNQDTSTVELSDGYPISGLTWQDQNFDTRHRITIFNKQTQQPIWVWSDITDADDNDNSFNGETTYSAIYSAVVDAFTATGGGGGGGTSNVNVTASVLPNGAATEATQQQVATALQLLDDVVAVLATPAVVPTKSLLISGYDTAGLKQYPVPVSQAGDAAGSARALVIGGVRNRSDIRALPIIGAVNAEQVSVEHRLKSMYRNTALSNVKQQIGASAGFIYGWHIINPNASIVYVKFYQGTFGSVIVGTTTPTFTLAIPASGIVDAPANVRALFFCSDAITVACVTGIADSSTTAPATPILTQIYYSANDYA